MLIDEFIEEEQFHHYFQPIFDIKNEKKLGYEVLLRTDVYPNPEFAFQEAKKADRLNNLDTRSIKKALANYASLGDTKHDALLFVNAYPSTISDASFVSFLDNATKQNGLSKEQIVLEISEAELIEYPECFVSDLKVLKQQGYKVALDDVGKGYANFDMLIELEPDYIKLDKLFANQLENSKKKQGLIRFFLVYCEENQVELILEGLETESEMLIAKSLGVPIGQGYYLGRPAALGQAINHSIG